jgi:predicted RND superfamily exporter protein
MKSFSRWVVEHYKLIIVICALLLIPGFYGMATTKINYDILTYLPQNLNSVQGQNILEKDFRVAGNAFLLVEDQQDWQVQDLKKRIEKIDGVEKVIWNLSPIKYGSNSTIKMPR